MTSRDYAPPQIRPPRRDIAIYVAFGKQHGRSKIASCTTLLVVPQRCGQPSVDRVIQEIILVKLPQALLVPFLFLLIDTDHLAPQLAREKNVHTSTASTWLPSVPEARDGEAHQHHLHVYVARRSTTEWDMHAVLLRVIRCVYHLDSREGSIWLGIDLAGDEVS